MKNIIRKSLESVQSKKLSKKDYDLIKLIMDRAEDLDIVWKDRMTLFMDLDNAATEFNIDLEGLLNADDSNFIHDVAGIQREINRRDEKKFDGLFVPRYAKSEKSDTELESKNEDVSISNEPVNRMIRNTLMTNSNKTPKYAKELTDLGYELIKDAPSAQGFWGVKGPNQVVVVSKDLGNKRRLYKGNGFEPVANVNGDKFKSKFDKIDLKNMLDKDDFYSRSEQSHIDEDPISEDIGKFVNAKLSVKYDEESIKELEKRVIELNKLIAEKKKDIERYNSKIEKNRSLAKDIYEKKVLARKK